MQYGHRYTPLLQRVGLHVVTQLVRHGLPNFNAPALTALVDRFTLNLCPHGFLCIRCTILTYIVGFVGGGLRHTVSTCPVVR
jgi:hypothetical protein